MQTGMLFSVSLTQRSTCAHPVEKESGETHNFGYFAVFYQHVCASQCCKGGGVAI